jgi:hypothetical protein
MRIVVVFPAPFGPRKPTTFPRSTEKEIASTALTGPKLLDTSCNVSKDIALQTGCSSPVRSSPSLRQEILIAYPVPIQVLSPPYPAADVSGIAS